MTSRLLLTLIAFVVLVIAFSAPAGASTIGPGDTATGSNDSATSLIAVDLVNPVALAPGVYTATHFNRQFTVANGTAQPLVLTGSGTSYTPRAVGATQTGSPVGAFTASDFGGSNTFAVGTGQTVYAGIYLTKPTTSLMPIGFLNNSGSAFLRFGGPAVPVVGAPISGGGSGTFPRTYDFSVDVVQQQTGQVGNTVSSRAAITDSATSVFWSTQHAIPYAGKVHLVDIHDQGQSGNFELFQLRATDTTGNAFQVINRSGAIAVATVASGNTTTYVLPTAFDVLPGDVIYHRGNGIPYTQDSSTAAAHNNQTIYNNATAAAIGGNLTLGTGNFPAYPANAQKRDYAWAVQAPKMVEQVGNGTTNGQYVDGGSGLLGVLGGDGFTQVGRVDQWHIFSNGGTTGRSLTPLIFRETATGFEVTGIGTARVSDNSGLQMFDFGLVSGSDVVGPDYFAGWWDGGGTTANQGVIEFSDADGTFATRFWLDSDGITLGNIYDDGTNGLAFSYTLARQYSINFTTQAVPEPGTLTLLTLALAGAAGIARRRASARSAFASAAAAETK